MSLKQQIESDIKKAMLARQKDELKALRAVKSMILLAETEKGSSGELTEDAENKMLMKAVKQRRDSAQIYKEQGREDLCAVEMEEVAVIEKYLPKQLSLEEVAEVVKGVIAQLGASGPQDMGKVMGAATKALAGQSDGKTISGIVRQLLTQ
ncbi:MAG: GatB/YqeY domain-containing protein [Roseivirga sp.]|nr:GatB/YqeY domain-containing protein [Roseivirga sp.]